MPIRSVILTAFAGWCFAGSAGCICDPMASSIADPFWRQDDVEYFVPSPEFELARDAARTQTESEPSTPKTDSQ